VCAALVSGVEAAPVFEPPENVLAHVPVAVEHGMVDWDFAVGFRRDAGGDAAYGQGISKPAGVVEPVAGQDAGRGRTLHISAALLYCSPGRRRVASELASPCYRTPWAA
jgi:hypothetical protein